MCYLQCTFVQKWDFSDEINNQIDSIQSNWFQQLLLALKVRKWLFSLIGLANPKDEAAESRPKYDFADEVLAWRIKLRKEK